MLRSMNDLKNYAIRATDGDIGRVKDFYFDSTGWVIRHVVVDTGTWRSSRKVLISPTAIGQPNRREKVLPISITKEQVMNSPGISARYDTSAIAAIRTIGGVREPSRAGMMVPRCVGFASAPRYEQSEAEKSFAPAEAARYQNDEPISALAKR